VTVRAHEWSNPRLPLVAGIGIILVFAAYAHFFSTVPDWGGYALPPFRPKLPRISMVSHFGAENLTIGIHVAQGTGFTDPFAFGTGPTAWMAPVYPLVVAGLVFAFGADLEMAGLVMALAQAAGFIWIWCSLVAVVRPQTRVNRIALLAALVLFLLSHFEYTFLWTHDYFLAAVMLAAVIRFAPSIAPPQSWRGWARWGIIGGLATLCAPAIALPWVLISLPRVRGNRHGLAIAAIAFAIVLTPWTIRNAVVFGKFIPIKSNAAYELYQTLQFGDDGLVTDDVLSHHPGRPGPEMNEYRDLGESAYLERKSEQARELLIRDPIHYVRQCITRLWAMFVWQDTHYIDYDWPIPHWFCRLVYPLPLLGLIAIVFKREWRRDPAAGVAVLAAIGLAIPYALVSYYERYEYAFAPAKIMLMWYALKACFRRQAA
jgi:hypothetical protein